MQKEIIAAIAAYLEKEIRPRFSGRTEYGSYEFNSRGATSRDLMPKFCQEIATEIAAAIAPLVEAWEPYWEDAPEWAEWRTVGCNGCVMWWEEKPVISKDFPVWTYGGRGWANGELSESWVNKNWENSLQRRPK